MSEHFKFRVLGLASRAGLPKITGTFFGGFYKDYCIWEISIGPLIVELWVQTVVFDAVLRACDSLIDSCEPPDGLRVLGGIFSLCQLSLLRPAAYSKDPLLQIPAILVLSSEGLVWAGRLDCYIGGYIGIMEKKMETTGIIGII